MDAPLVVGANRDEGLERPALPMVVLGDGPRRLGGRDELAGGTWLALNEHGVFAGLTNRPTPDGRDPSKRSRGELPLQLAAHRSAVEAAEDFERTVDPVHYNPAWLLVGDRHDLISIDLSGDRPMRVTPLPPGVHVLENQALDAPSAKAVHVRALLGEAIATLAPDERRRALRGVLGHHEPALDGDDGSGRPAFTTAACVHSEQYGTRWSGLIEVPADHGALPSFTFTDGPPCSSPWRDAGDLWAAGPGTG